MRPILAAIALALGGLGVAGCHTTNPLGVCNAYLAETNNGGGSWSTVDADARGDYFSCLFRNNTTFATDRDCLDITHSLVADSRCS